ncbi:peroxiredoxin family protein [Marinigracilibium pacificum]|uniref:TlpA family protein disulfide reductase n=1 Tax=Marinigracilibium pacificum TaxID=2729599 RepID=A0A848IY64_9BACT|nr:peroxiredoxin family protein [Marinigracilibium pacificum]NMM48576.1 TlpA family protein disulfide reductase [Marinigracilibium pacificum]
MTHSNYKWVLLSILLLFNLSISYSQNNANITPIQKAPEFTLNDLSGNEISMSDYSGQFVVIHIATTWCPFCNAEAPYLEKLSQEYASKNVKVFIIDVKEPLDLVKMKLQDKFNFSFPILLDSDGKVAASFAPDVVLPDLARDEVMLASNLIIDPNGQIQFMSLLDSKNFDAKLIALQKRLDELLQEN